jgi:predicted RNase H-like HicB family nuclease
MAEMTTTTKTTYIAVYERDASDDAWNVHIRGLDGCQTYGRSLRQAQHRIREALAVWLDQDPAALTIRDQLPDELTAVTTQVRRARDAAERAGLKAQEQTAQAAKTLTELGLSRRDAGEILGLSHQRVQQLLEAS